jgi:hypothetical protein
MKILLQMTFSISRTIFFPFGVSDLVMVAEVSAELKFTYTNISHPQEE